MKTLVHFRGFEGLEHLRGFVKDCLERSVSRFEKQKALSAEVHVGTLFPRSQTHGADYSCEVVVRDPTSHRTIVVKKQGEDFYTAVRNCVEVVERVMARLSDRRTARRRRRHWSVDGF